MRIRARYALLLVLLLVLLSCIGKSGNVDQRHSFIQNDSSQIVDYTNEFPCLEPLGDDECKKQLEFAREVKALWDSSGRPWIQTGGTALNMLRIGSVSLTTEALRKSEEDDFEAIMIFEDEDDMRKTYKRIEKAHAQSTMLTNLDFTWNDWTCPSDLKAIDVYYKWTWSGNNSLPLVEALL